MANNSGNITSVYLFSIVALLILIIAGINYVNLATARSSARTREVGLKKVLGVTPGKLAIQFIAESIMITFVAIILAMCITEIVLPYFNSLLDTALKIDFAGNYIFNIGLIALLLVLGLTSGLYPAFLLSRFKPSEALKSSGMQNLSGTIFLRKILVIFQFIITTSLIFATGVILHQIVFMHNKDKGYNDKNVVYLHLNQQIEPEGLQDFKSALLSIPEVINVGSASNYNGVAGRQSTAVVADSLNTEIMVRYGYVDPDFFPTMEIDFIDGRNFDYEYRTDPLQSVIINQAAANSLGWNNPIGKRFVNSDYPDNDFEQHIVVGVINDYNYYSLHSPVEPALYIYDPAFIRTVNIRYKSSNTATFVSQIEKAFNEFFPGSYFDLHYLENIFALQYRMENNLMKLVQWFALFCIFISCLGLFGLTMFIVDQKRKEIGIRKVLGGTVMQINTYLSKMFLRWIIIASLISLPATWLIMQRWLENFSYSISIGWYHVAISLLLVSLIALLTIFPITARVALENPVKTISCE